MAASAKTIFSALSGRAADQTEARNGLRHVVSLTLTKIADGLIDPKLVLSWLLTALGSPQAMIALLVPIREAGALLPQIFLGQQLARMRHRKWMWVLASLGQGMAAVGIAITALSLSGWAAGLMVCVLLSGLAVSRAAASVSYKDILGKTVGTARRGVVTGTAGSASALAVVAFALLLMSGALQNVGAIAGVLMFAGLLWCAAAGIFAGLDEPASDPETSPGITLAPLRDDPQLRRFLLVRGALTATALAPPFLVMLAGSASGLGQLGTLVLASAAASFLSSYVWGRMSDRSSRRVLIFAGVGGAVAMGLAITLDALELAQTFWAIPLALFALMIAYHGVRQGRSTYLVDMAPSDQRPAYAALANTVIGTLLLLVGILGGALGIFGPQAALAGLAGLCLLGAYLALGLEEVEDT